MALSRLFRSMPGGAATPTAGSAATPTAGIAAPPTADGIVVITYNIGATDEKYCQGRKNHGSFSNKLEEDLCTFFGQVVLR